MNIAPEGIEPSPPDYEPGPLPLSYGAFAWSGIRTHEANARGLKSRPFDHSGIHAKMLSATSSQ